ncbi:MAG: zinc-ribbon domain-containing protein [Myxococcales bacterium]|nr:zinc-ribbon domain-containing protein [Myxococcales bacterium]
MIVKCSQCQTRFKIPDEKVTEKGVKVRCTKCQHTFRVKRAPAEAQPAVAPPPARPAPAPVSPGRFNPFEAFGEASTAGDDATRPALYQAPSPPSPRLGPKVDPFAAFTSEEPSDGTRPMFNPSEKPLEPSYEAQKHLPIDAFEEPTRVGSHLASESPLPPEPSTIPSARPFRAQAKPARGPLTGEDWTVTNPTRPDAPTALLTGTAPGVPAFTNPKGVRVPPAPAASEQVIGDLPEVDELFSRALSSEESTDPGVVPKGVPRTEDRAALFDLPPPPEETKTSPAETRPAAGAPPQGAAIARIALVKRAVGPDSVKQERPARPSKRSWKTVLVNVALALLVLPVLAVVAAVYLNEGQLDFSVPRIRAMFVPREELIAVDISNGLYDAQVGKPLFFVRGLVENRTEKPGQARVRAEILEDGQLVSAAEAFAGASTSPEDLFQISSGSDVEGMNRRIDFSTVVIAPHGRKPFLIAFHEYPPNLQSFWVKVTVREVVAWQDEAP